MHYTKSAVLGITLIFCFASSLVSSFATNGEINWKRKMEKLQKYAKDHNILEEDHTVNQYVLGTKYFNLSMECRETPTSVHRLRPQNIDVVAAMGDSLTAANGANATTVVGVAREYRGLSWSIGGEGEVENTLTLPNILKLFNPSLSGYSIGTRFDSNRDWTFNVAVPGAMVNEMTDQAQLLVERMKTDTRVNFEKDWKLLTIFIGGNDLCDLDSREASQPENYVASLQEALDYLHDNMVRTLVNVVNILEVYSLREVGFGVGGTAACRAMQRLFCSFIVTANETELEWIKIKNREYQTLTEDLIKSGRYDTREDFTVVLQPFLEDTVLPFTEDGEVDASYFAPDCFHFSAKGHAIGAVNLWNNMLEPVGQKHKQWEIADIKCPTQESPYIFTNLNSRELQASTTLPASTTTPVSPSVSSSCTSYQTDTWVIVLACLLGAAFFVQTIILIILLRNKTATKRLT